MPARSRSTSSRNSNRNLPAPPSLWQTIGPSFILLGLALGSGELILWPYLTANYGLGLLWGGLLGISFQFVLNTEVMRYSLAWGESVFVGFRRLSIFIPIWYVISTFIPWSLPGFSSASAEIINHVVPSLPPTLISLGLLVMTGLIISAGKTLYRTMEIFQKSIILMGLPFIALLSFFLTSRADWIEYAQGLIGMGDGYWFFPQGVAIASFLGAFAYSGAGGNLNLAQSYYVKEKGFGMGKYAGKITSLFAGGAKAQALEGATFEQTPANRKLWDRWWTLVNWEHWLVFWLLGFITISLLAVLAKATVYGLPVQSGILFLFTEGEVINQRISPFFGTVFLLVSALTLFSTQVGVLESSSRIISENVLLLFSKPGQKYNISRWFYVALWAQIGLGAVIYLSGFNEPRFLLTLGAVLNAAAMMSSFVLIFVLNKLRLKPSYQPGVIRGLIILAATVFFAIFLGFAIREFKI